MVDYKLLNFFTSTDFDQTKVSNKSQAIQQYTKQIAYKYIMPMNVLGYV